MQTSSVKSPAAEARQESVVSGGDGTWGRWMRSLAKFHSWEVVGTETIPKKGGLIFVGPHCLATYDLFIAVYASSEFLGRPVYIVGDDLLFKIPGMASFLRKNGFISGNREELTRRVRAGDAMGIAPGGMKESLRSTRHAYEFDWSARKGFAAISLNAGAPIIPTVCPNSDHIYTVYENRFTPWAYDRFKVPLPFFRGRGFSPLPRPVKLVTWVGKPIFPDVAPDQVTDRDVERHHGRVIEAVSALMKEARNAGETPVGREYLYFDEGRLTAARRDA